MQSQKSLGHFKELHGTSTLKFFVWHCKSNMCVMKICIHTCLVFQWQRRSAMGINNHCFINAPAKILHQIMLHMLDKKNKNMNTRDVFSHLYFQNWFKIPQNKISLPRVFMPVFLTYLFVPHRFLICIYWNILW